MVLTPQLLKSVVERGRWTRLFVEAQKLYAAGDLDSALMIYLLLSELGFEVAQSNSAYILDQGEQDIIVIVVSTMTMMLSCAPEVRYRSHMLLLPSCFLFSYPAL